MSMEIDEAVVIGARPGSTPASRELRTHREGARERLAIEPCNFPYCIKPASAPLPLAHWIRGTGGVD